MSLVPADQVLDLDGTEPPWLPAGSVRTRTLATRVPPHVAAWVQEEARLRRTTPAQLIARLIMRERDGGLPDDCREWLTRQAAQCGVPGDPDAALVLVLRHLADRWPNGARLR